MRFGMALTVLATVLCAGSLSALGVGEKGPNYKFTKSWNTPTGFDELDDYRGKVVLVERWATWCGPCMQNVPHLEELNKKFREKGFEICATSDEGVGTIQSGLIDAKKPTYGVIAQNISNLYATNGIPHGWVLDPEGKCLWEGHPAGLNDSMIEGWLKELAPSKVDKELSKDLGGAVKAFDKGDVGKAMVETKRVADAATDEAVKADCEYMNGLIKKHQTMIENKIKAAGESVFAKVAAIEEGATKFKGSELGDKWDAEAKELKKSKDYEASKKLEELKPSLKDLPEASARKKLESIAKKYPETAAGKEAAELARQYPG